MVAPITTSPPEPGLAIDRALKRYSVSAMKEYLSCSLKFYFARILKLPKPTPASFQVGKAVHKGLQVYNLAVWRDEDSSEGTIIKKYHQAWLDLEKIDPPEYKNANHRKELLETGARVVRAYLNSEIAQVGGKPTGVEVKLESHDHPYDGPLVGIIDLVRKGNIVVDFKTAAATPSNLDMEAFLNESQLVCYQMLIEENTGEKVKGLELIYLIKTKTPKIIRHQLPPATQQQKDRFMAMFSEYVDGVYHEVFYPSPGMQCSYCPYVKQCKQWKGKQ